MNKSIKCIFIIVICFFLNYAYCITQIEPPSQYPYNGIVKSDRINLSSYTPCSPAPCVLFDHSMTPNTSPIILSFENNPGLTNCVDYRYKGVVNARLFVANHSTNSGNLYDFYEFGKHYDPTGTTNDFKFDINVTLEIKAYTLSCYNSVPAVPARTYNVTLNIKSDENKVQNTKVIETNFDEVCGTTPENLIYFVVTKASVNSHNTNRLADSKIFISLDCDVVPMNGVVNTSIPTEPLVKVDWNATGGSTFDILQHTIFDFKKMNQTSEENINLTTIVPPFDPYIFKWDVDYACEEFHPYLYQLQILKLHNIKFESAYLSNPRKVYAEVNWDQALTIETRGDIKELKNYVVTEGSGYYIWRIRPIGNLYEGGLANSKNYGLWNSNYVNGTSTTDCNYQNGDIINIDNVDGSNVPHGNICAYYFEIKEDVNWIHSRVFSEGKNDETQFHDVMQYYDNLLNLRQSQKTLPSTKVSITQQNLLDYQGRPVVQSLPAPVAGLGRSSNSSGYGMVNLQYKPDLFPKNYLTSNFDNAYGVPNALAVTSSDPSLLNEYYNGDAVLGYGMGTSLYNVPNAENYPFTRTVLSNDGLNRVVEQSLPGNTHRIRDLSSTSVLDIHTIRNFYTQATEEEIVSMFGKEAPNPKTVSKDINIDPNNVITFTYKDLQGRIIATALKQSDPDDVPNLLVPDHDIDEGIFNDYMTYRYDEQEQNGWDFIVRGNVVFPGAKSGVEVKYDLNFTPFSYNYSCNAFNIVDYNMRLGYDYNVKLINHLDNSVPFNKNNTSPIPAVASSVPYNYSMPTETVSSILYGEHRAVGKFTLKEPERLKNELVEAIDNSIENNIYNKYKLGQVISAIDYTQQQILLDFKKYSDEANAFNNKLVNDLKTDPGNADIWEETPSTSGKSSTFTTKDLPCELEFKYSFGDCEDCEFGSEWDTYVIEGVTKIDFSKEILRVLYNKYKNQDIYYVDPVDVVAQSASKFTLNIADANLLNTGNLSSDEKKYMNYLFYQSKIPLSKKFDITQSGKWEIVNWKLKWVTTNHYNVNWIDNMYDRINILLNNMYNDTDPNTENPGRYDPKSVCAAVKNFVYNFDLFVRKSNETDAKEIQNMRKGVYLVNFDINTLDELFKYTNKKYIGFSDNPDHYINYAYKYIKKTVGHIEVIEKQYIAMFNANYPTGANQDRLIGFNPLLHAIPDECTTPTTLADGDKDWEKFAMWYDGVIRALWFGNTIAKIKAEHSNGNKVGDKTTAEMYLEMGYTEEEMNMMEDAMEGALKGEEKLTPDQACKLANKNAMINLNQCAARRPMFRIEVLDFLHDRNYFEVGEDIPSGVTPVAILTKKDIDAWTDLLVMDCEKYTKAEYVVDLTKPSKIKRIGEDIINDFETARTKYLNALERGKKLNIEKLFVDGKFNQADGTPSTPSPQGSGCRFQANLSEQSFTTAYLLNIANNYVVPELNKKVMELRQNISTNVEIQNLIETRAENYKAVIDHLETFLSTNYPFLENKIKSNADWNDDLHHPENSYYTCFYYPNENRFNLDPVLEMSEFLSIKGLAGIHPYQYVGKNPKYRLDQTYLAVFSDIEVWNNYYDFSKNEGRNFYHRGDSYTISPINLRTHLRTRSRAFLLRDLSRGNDKYGYNFFVNTNILQPRSLWVKRDNAMDPIYDFAQTNEIRDTRWDGGVIPINFRLQQFDVGSSTKRVFNKPKLENKVIFDFNFESIWISVKDGYSPDCDQMFALTGLSADTDPVPGEHCYIVYNFTQENNAVPPLVKEKALCTMQTLQNLKRDIIEKVGDLRQKIMTEGLHEADKYLKNFKNNLVQNVSVTYKDTLRHFTLYYYDNAGNLVRTVPPKGAAISTSYDRTSNPTHKFVTYYKYNSKGQVLTSDSPDETEYNKFVYMRAGMLKLSQSARQKPNKCSYIRYDKFRRVIETGELFISNANLAALTLTNILDVPYLSNFAPTDYDAPNYRRLAPPAPPGTPAPPFVVPSILERTFRVNTDYSNNQAIPGFYGIPPNRNNLRNKINFIRRDEDGDTTSRGDQVITYYSYDIHGNVEFVIHDLPATKNGGTRLFARTDYDYDLISKKVKAVAYNFYESDSYMQEYSYDEDNRLTKVRTSRYGYVWERDADYRYYEHGPLQRIELGQDRIQGVDYTYTIQGWLKAINHIEVTNDPATTKEPGKDATTGMTPTQTAKDGYGMVLNYFTGDFQSSAQSIGSTERFADANRLNGNSGVANFNNLYNGNIASWESSYHMRNGINHGGNNSNTFDYTFQYDQLNRIKGSFTKERNSSYGWANVDNYNTSNSYDANGNIMSMIRLHNSTTFDKLEYNYLTNTNKLHRVTDGITSSAYVGDIEDGQLNYNYMYDPSGNLKRDEQSGINNISWTVDGKVKQIEKITGDIVKYLYDGMGNRIMKRVHGSTDMINYTIYARDANGQTLAIYEREVDIDQDEEEITITPCLKMTFNPEYATHGCTVDVELCPPLYTYDANTHEITINAPGLSIPLNAPCEGSNFLALPGTKFKLFDEKEGTYLQSNNFNSGSFVTPRLRIKGGFQITGSGGTTNYNMESALTLEIKVDPLKQHLMPKLAEWHVYGNSMQGRFVTKKPDAEPLYYLDKLTTDVKNLNFHRKLDKKEYELKDHLGNVRLAISDMKLPANEDVQTRGEAPFYVDEKAVNDYYPFGMLIADDGSDNRSWQAGNYRYGYNGKENDNEVKGEGNQIDFGARIYDTRLGKFLSTDPLQQQFVDYSPYLYAGNSPIFCIDVDGKKQSSYRDKNGNWITAQDNNDNSYDLHYRRTNNSGHSFWNSNVGIITGSALAGGAALGGIWAYSTYGVTVLSSTAATWLYYNANKITNFIGNAFDPNPYANYGNDLVSSLLNKIAKNCTNVIVKMAEEITIPKGSFASYRAGTPVVEFVTTSKEEFVRVFKEGTKSKSAGRWLMKKSEIEGLSPAEIQKKFSLPQIPDRIVDVTVPAGTQMRTGTAAAAKSVGGTGGGQQFQILDDKIDESWFSTPGKLKK